MRRRSRSRSGASRRADAEVDARAPVGRVEVPEIVAFAVGDHLERQLVVVAQEDRPLAVRRDVRRLSQDVGDREAVLLRDRHVHPRHQREVERHMAFVAVAEILLRVLGPHVGLGQQQATRIVAVHLLADQLQDVVRLAQILVARALALDQVRHRVEPEAVNAEVEPPAHHVDDRLHDLRIVEVQVRLMREEAVPEVRAGHRIPRPVWTSRCRRR